MMECLTCGGTDYIIESGFYYCTECQTQSQEVREHVFEEEVTNVKSTKKIKKKKTEKVENKITSWECYNIVMCGLTQEIVNLGAKPNYKKIVKCLWMKYLEKLEVINLETDVKPRFSIVNLKKDVNIIFNKDTKKRRRKSSGDDDSFSNPTTPTSVKRERTKKKRLLAQAHYDDYSFRSTQESNTSLMNETLTSLKGSEKSEPELKINFNKYAKKELRRRMPKEHIQVHRTDIPINLRCHNFTYQESTMKFKKGVGYLSPMKLYAILYLALLINRDDIHLGDLLRFIREGHVSYNNYHKFFPEEFENKSLNIHNNSKNCMLSHKNLRVLAAKLAAVLDVTEFIEIPDLPALCKRYCKELNLPVEVYHAVENLLSKTCPLMVFDRTSPSIPNYEGRCISFILFTLKLLFGLDDVTEFRLSEYAKIVNENHLKMNMFDIIAWMEYIGYRTLVIQENHLPTAHYKDAPIDGDVMLHYINSHEVSFNSMSKLSKEMSDYKDILMKLKKQQHDYVTYLQYPATLTPFLDYAHLISSTLNRKYLQNILVMNFSNESLQYLLNPNKYLQHINADLIKIHRGANANWVLSAYETWASTRGASMKQSNLMPLRLIEEGEYQAADVSSSDEEEGKANKKALTASVLLGQFQLQNKKKFEKNERFLDSLSEPFDDTTTVIGANQKYCEHFQPYEQYWMSFMMNLDLVVAKHFNAFYQKWPSSFRFIFDECCRMVEQKNQEFFDEYQLTEIYLIYAATSKKRPKCNANSGINYYANAAATKW